MNSKTSYGGEKQKWQKHLISTHKNLTLHEHWRLLLQFQSLTIYEKHETAMVTTWYKKIRDWDMQKLVT